MGSGEGQTLSLVSTTPSECVEGLCRPGEPCSSPEVVAALSAFIRTRPEFEERDPPPPAGAGEPELLPHRGVGAAIIRRAAGALGCSSESCLVSHPEVRGYLDAAVPGSARELDTRFKEGGPREGRALLSNFNIDGTLQRWAYEFEDFYNYPFCMMDFARTGGVLVRHPPAEALAGRAKQIVRNPEAAEIEKVRRACRCMGCIVNTDVSTGLGLHWVAVFVDCRSREAAWTLEYFNSAGNPPPREMTRWLEETRRALAAARARKPRTYGGEEVKVVPVTSFRHQRSQTECGLYSLFYIRSRLEGVSPATFMRGGRITDEVMAEFRRHVFRGET